MTSNENVYVPTKFGACIKNRKIFKLSHRPHSYDIYTFWFWSTLKERSQIDAFSLKTLSVLVWMEMPKRIEIFCVSKRKRSSSVDEAKVVIKKKKKKCCLKLRRKTFKGIGTKICSLGCAISVKNN